MSTMIPIIWIVELDLLDKRIHRNQTTVAPSQENHSGVSSLVKKVGLVYLKGHQAGS